MPQTEKLIILQPKVSLIDPHINTDDRNTLSPLFNIFETLVRFRKTYDYEGILAHNWDISPNATEWIFYLRHPVYFHDGNVLKSSDVIKSIKRILDPETNGELGTKGIYHEYLGKAVFDALDEYTVKITTPEPMADLLDFLAKFPIAPSSRLNDLTSKMIGTGPYLLSSLSPNRIEMERFEGYWGKKPFVQYVVWKEESNPQRRIDLLLNHEVDLVSGIAPEGAKEIKQSGKASVLSIESSLCTVFMCNHFKGVCKDKRIRQALNYGLNKDEIINGIMGGFANPLNGPLTQVHLGYNPKTPVYPYDPQKARQLFAEAGFPSGTKLVLDVPLKIPDEAPALVKSMAAQYERIGLHIEIKEFSDRTLYANMVRNKQIDDACCFDSSPMSTYQVLSDKFHSGLHGAWWQGYENREVDQLIDLARQTPDLVQRRLIYQQAYQLLNEDAPWIFLYSPIRIWGVGPNAVGWKPDYDGLIHL